MTLEIRHARTSDGVNIAYFAIGGGPVPIDGQRAFAVRRGRRSW